jgi:hemoglobin
MTAEKIEKFKTDLLHLASKKSGGPYDYNGPDMLEIHKGMGITDAEFNAFVDHLKKAFDKNGVNPLDQALFLKGIFDKRKDIVEK